MRLIEGDCLQLMAGLPPASIDLILCDLPYGTTDCPWDSVIPMKPLWEQYRRIIRPTGVIALFGTEPFSTHLRMEALDLYKYDWIWEKQCPTNFFHAKNMPMRAHEHISIFSGGSIGHRNLLGDRRMPYNPQGLQEYGRQKGKRPYREGGVYGDRPSHRRSYVQGKTGYPTSILRYRMNIEGRVHASQKPVALLEYLVRTYTEEGQTVLDNCMGSGSTGVACVNTGRNFIGMELEPEFFETASRRILEAEEVLYGPEGNSAGNAVRQS